MCVGGREGRCRIWWRWLEVSPGSVRSERIGAKVNELACRTSEGGGADELAFGTGSRREEHDERGGGRSSKGRAYGEGVLSS